MQYINRNTITFSGTQNTGTVDLTISPSDGGTVAATFTLPSSMNAKTQATWFYNAAKGSIYWNAYLTGTSVTLMPKNGHALVIDVSTITGSTIGNRAIFETQPGVRHTLAFQADSTATVDFGFIAISGTTPPTFNLPDGSNASVSVASTAAYGLEVVAPTNLLSITSTQPGYAACTIIRN